MHRTINAILSKRLVTLVGSEGIGKTAVANGACLYISDRRLFEDGVVHVRLRSIITYPDFLDALTQAFLQGEDNILFVFLV